MDQHSSPFQRDVERYTEYLKRGGLLEFDDFVRYWGENTDGFSPMDLYLRSDAE